MRTMDLIEPGFRPLYERVCVGNKGENAQSIFFEGMLLEEGFGTSLSCLGERFFMLMLIPYLRSWSAMAWQVRMGPPRLRSQICQYARRLWETRT